MEIIITNEKIPNRLDKYLTSQISQNIDLLSYKDLLTRNFVQNNLIDFVSVNGKRAKASYKLKLEDRIGIDIEKIKKFLDDLTQKKLEIDKIIPENGSLDIVYEDQDYLVINKPKGVPVHPGNENSTGTMANYVKGYLVNKNEYDPLLERGGIVHRLDLPVSGLMIFAKNISSQQWFKKKFEDHEIFKIYRLRTVENSKEIKIYKDKITSNYLADKWLRDEIDLNEWNRYEGYIGRSRNERIKMEYSIFKVNNSFKNAQSFLIRTGEYEYYINIRTGRMHQIRATLDYLGLHIEGDTMYGSGRQIPKAIDLESVVLGFVDNKETKKVYVL